VRTRSLLPLAALLLAAVPFRLHPASAFAAPSCFGKPATHVMQPGEGTYVGTPGDDIELAFGGGGTDLACGGPGSKAAGGLGADSFVAAYFGATADGGSGNDLGVYAEGAGSVADGGTGADEVDANEGGTAYGGSGNDRLDYWGGAGGGLYGGSGRDTLTASFDAFPAVMDCGSGDDAYQPGSATVRRCERAIP
jgi:hypothetical protein